MQKKAVFAITLAVGLLVGANKAVVAQTVQDTTSRTNSSSPTGATSAKPNPLGSSTSVSTQSSANAYGPMGAGRESRGGMKAGGSTDRDLAISAAKSADHTVLFRALRVSGLSEQAAGKGPYVQVEAGETAVVSCGKRKLFVGSVTGWPETKNRYGRNLNRW
jgi:hypothetical protein